jgi:hypothetical protein
VPCLASLPSPDDQSVYRLGLQLATAPDHTIHEALADRPATRALILRLSRMLREPNSGQLDAFMNPVPRPNQRVLYRIVPPPMPRRYRYAAVTRLRRMQREMGGGNIPRIGWTAEIPGEGERK